MDVVKHLTKAGADVTVADGYGRTPVYVASENVSIENVLNIVLYACMCTC